MSAVLHPVGPRPERVYWRRRVVALLVLVTVVILVWGVLSGTRGSAAEGDDGAATTASQGETPSDDAGEVPPEGDTAAPAGADPVDAVQDPSGEQPDAEAPAAEPVAAGPVGCDVADLALTVTTDARSYPVGAEPVLTVAVANTGAVTCVVDAATATGQVEVMSGADRIWSSGDCGEPAPESLALLEPGARTEATVTWPRVRSAAGCPGDLPEPRTGTYTAAATALGATSATAVFDLE